MKTVKLASTKYLDSLPTPRLGGRPRFRDLAMEAEVLAMTQSLGVGAQFRRKYFCHDVRVIRCRATARACRSVWACRARPTARRWLRSPAMASTSGARAQPAKYLPEVDTLEARRRCGEDRPQHTDDGILAQLAKHRSKPAVAVGPAESWAGFGARQAAQRLENGQGCPITSRTIRSITPAGENPDGYASGGSADHGGADGFVVADFQQAAARW